MGVKVSLHGKFLIVRRSVRDQRITPDQDQQDPAC